MYPSKYLSLWEILLSIAETLLAQSFHHSSAMCEPNPNLGTEAEMIAHPQSPNQVLLLKQ